jgi:hypothetical protein
VGVGVAEKVGVRVFVGDAVRVTVGVKEGVTETVTGRACVGILVSGDVNVAVFFGGFGVFVEVASGGI